VQVLQVFVINPLNIQLKSVFGELPVTTTKPKGFGPRRDQLVANWPLAQLRYYITYYFWWQLWWDST
jgi:hypothetical protein